MPYTGPCYQCIPVLSLERHSAGSKELVMEGSCATEGGEARGCRC
jgi:hypothetical protein